jgi:hypothetical protein
MSRVLGRKSRIFRAVTPSRSGFALALGLAFFSVLINPCSSVASSITSSTIPEEKTVRRVDLSPDHPQPWPERLWRRVQTLGDELVVSLSTAIFDGLDQLDVNFLRIPGNTRLGFRTERAVLDNFDLLNTYTVIDRTRFRVRSNPLHKITTWDEDQETPLYGAPFAALLFEAQTAIEWMNIRQVGARKYNEQVLKGEAPSFSIPYPVGNEAVSSESPLLLREEDVKDLNPDVSLSYFDPEIRAQFAKLPNLLTFPFRLPLHRKDVSKMHDGEILSYSFDAQVEVGVSAGLKIIPDLGVLHAGVDVRGSLFTHGRFQITVLREDARFARVKLTRLNEKGAKTGIRAGVKRRKVLNDFLVFKGKSLVSSVSLNIVPFDFEAARIAASQFDVVYRYDLDSEEGRKAYHRAVLGRFALSEETADSVIDLEGKSVERLVSRELRRKTRLTSVKSDLSHFLRLRWNAKREALEASIELEDGTRTVFEGKREKSSDHRFLFGAVSEKATKRITLAVDADRFHEGSDDSVFIIAEVLKNDSRTSAKELNTSIQRMGDLLRKRDILPQAVDFGNRRTWYGRSSFHYGYSLSMKELREFLSLDRSRVEAAALGNLKQGDVEAFMAAWDDSARAFRIGSDPKAFFTALSSLFTERFALERLTAVLFDSLAETEIEYFVSAQNTGFGRVQIRGKTVTSVEQALTRTDRQLGWESYSRLKKVDPESVVSAISVTGQSNGLSSLRFSFSHRPANVYFRVYKISGVKRQTTLAEVVVSNYRGRFKAGVNSLILDPFSTDPLVGKLSKNLREGERYLVMIAFSRMNDRFGALSSASFRVDEGFGPEVLPPLGQGKRKKRDRSDHPTTETSDKRANSGPK